MPPTAAATPGFALSARTHVCDGGRSLVGAAGRVVHLSPDQAAVLARSPLVPDDDVARSVARLLVDEDLAHPWWPGPAASDAEVDDVTVVVPTRDRAEGVAGLLASLPPQVPAMIVDDGSVDRAALTAVAARHGAALVRHDRNRGPAAARNTGLRAASTPFVAFCDSDVLPEPGWLGVLRRHLDDPEVAVAGPRVLGRAGTLGDSWVERYEDARSSLDLGPAPAAVRAGGAVSYLPGACLLVRRAALGDGFDESLRAGEDVDLVWRLVAGGWRVRYEPGATVRHDHRTGLGPWLARKAFYGTSAAPLAVRHPGAGAPLTTTPTAAVLVAAVLAQRCWSLPVAGAALAVSTVAGARRLDRNDRPLLTAATLAVEDAVSASWQAASALLRPHWPLAALWAAGSRRGRRAVLAAAVLEGLADRRRVRPDLGPLPYVVTHRLDDLAYGAGVWRGALRERSVRALVPVVRRRSLGWR